jgi:ribosomal subunit interface protein
MMLINIQSRQFSLSPALSDYVKSKVRVMLGRFETKISKIDVSMFDINGPRGGEDKCCKLIIRVNGNSPVVVEETAEDLYDAINTCVRRARRAVKRQVSIRGRTRQKISDLLLLNSESPDMQNTVS